MGEAKRRRESARAELTPAAAAARERIEAGLEKAWRALESAAADARITRSQMLLLIFEKALIRGGFTEREAEQYLADLEHQVIACGLARDGDFDIEDDCPQCFGTGRSRLFPAAPCHVCRGSGHNPTRC